MLDVDRGVGPVILLLESVFNVMGPTTANIVNTAAQRTVSICHVTKEQNLVLVAKTNLKENSVNMKLLQVFIHF